MGSVTRNRPNIIIILADDMGFSDLGCYGSEIQTPNLDSMAESGLRFTQMYNVARCCPSRAALLTGLNPHQAGVGHMTRDLGVPSYQGYLNNECVTIAEVLQAHGYRTLMSGKWHVGGGYNTTDPERAAGDSTHPTPMQRGFDRHFGSLDGGGSYFNPANLARDGTFISADSTDFYLTDAISDNAVEMIKESAGLEEPFFLYLAYTAPHWPLHALPDDIARYEGKYRRGWDSVRTSRHEQMMAMGLLDPRWERSPRDEDVPSWEDVQHKEWEDLRMAVYAAQVDRMDQGIGRVMAQLRESGLEENTLVMFLSDNGGCAEFLQEDFNIPQPSLYARPTLDGRPVRIGNDPGIRPGPADTFMSYELPWANASNSPFRLFKRWTHEGGISTPFVVSWPTKIKQSGIVHEPVQIIDIMATCIEAATARYPEEFNGNPIVSLEGESFVPLLEGQRWTRGKPIFWEHEGNRAVRVGQWKLVGEYPGQWELYDMEADRTELNDLAEKEPHRVSELVRLYEEWSQRCGVVPWPVDPKVTARRLHTKHSHIVPIRGEPDIPKR